jgi:hypothetical protein
LVAVRKQRLLTALFCFQKLLAVKADITVVQADIVDIRNELKNVATKAELKEEIAKLKGNDFYHTNRAILLFAADSAKRQGRGF